MRCTSEISERINADSSSISSSSDYRGTVRSDPVRLKGGRRFHEQVINLLSGSSHLASEERVTAGQQSGNSRSGGDHSRPLGRYVYVGRVEGNGTNGPRPA